MYEFTVLFMICLVEFAIFHHYCYYFLKFKQKSIVVVALAYLGFSCALAAINMLQMGLVNIFALYALFILFSKVLFRGTNKAIIILCAFINACLIISEVASDLVVFLVCGRHFSELEQYSGLYFIALLLSKSILLVAVRCAILVHAKMSSQQGMQSIAAVIFPMVSIVSIASLYYMLCSIADATKALTMFVFCVSMAMLVACLFVLYLFDRSVNQQVLQMQLRLAEQMIQAGDLYDKEKERAINDLKRITHDFRNQVINLQYLYNEGKNDEAGKLYHDMLDSLTADEILELLPLNNRVASAILYRTRLNCQSKHIDYQERIECDDLSFLSAIDTGAILDNLMDNAMEACQQVDEGNRFISVAMVQKSNLVVLQVRNSRCNTLLEQAERLVSTKTDKELHGIGISSVNAAANRYNGDVSHHIDDNTFTIEVRLSIVTQLRKA